MKSKQVVLILYANYGAGHKRAAKAIEAKLKNSMDRVEVYSRDFLGEAFPMTDWVMRKMYLQVFSWAKPIYQHLYYRTKDFSVDSPIFSVPSVIGSLKLERYLEEINPSIVISTFPTITGMLSKVKERGTFDFKLYCVLTDYVSHSQWLYHSVDRYFVPADKIQDELVQRGIHPSAITVTGIPVMPGFELKVENKALKRKWGVSDQYPVVLISAGAFGVVNIKEACQRLVHSCPRTQFMVVCGHNKKLYKKLSDVPAIHPLPFTKEIHELMQIADLFVTKAGGLSISEAIACEVPMVLFNSLPGQETENVKFLLRERVAKRAKTEEDLCITVSKLLNYPLDFQRMKQNVKDLHGRVSRSHVITETVLKEIGQKTRVGLDGTQKRDLL